MIYLIWNCRQSEGQNHPLWTGILPISFGSPHNISKSSPRSAVLENLFLPEAESDAFHLNASSPHPSPAISDTLLSGHSLSVGASHGVNYSSGDFHVDSDIHSFVRVAIPSYSTEVDSEGKYTAFIITVETDFATIEVLSYVHIVKTFPSNW